MTRAKCAARLFAGAALKFSTSEYTPPAANG
jgi:hypothetical protein